MRSSLFIVGALGIVCATFVPVACTADVHGNTINVDVPNLSISTDVDVNNIHPGQSVPVTIKGDMPPAPAPAADAGSSGSKTQETIIFKLFLDDDSSSTALAVTSSTSVNVTIPASTPPGPHKLLCRAFHHDGTPTDSETSIDITVTTSVSVTTSPSRDM